MVVAGCAAGAPGPCPRGRSSEMQVIDRLFERAFASEAGVLALIGEAGAGKSALLEAAADSPRLPQAGATVLRATGVQWERGLPLAGLVELLRPLRSLLTELPADTAELARALLGEGGRSSLDRFAVGVGTLGLLAAAGEHAPVAVLVDDAQWMDDPVRGSAGLCPSPAAGGSGGGADRRSRYVHRS